MKLSAKAQLFVRRAVAETASPPLRRAVHRLGSDPWSAELSPEAERLATDALDEQRRQIQARLATPLTDDEVADLSNDLAFIEAICSDLAHSVKSS
jgi:hypothetical protein